MKYYKENGVKCNKIFQKFVFKIKKIILIYNLFYI